MWFRHILFQNYTGRLLIIEDEGCVIYVEDVENPGVIKDNVIKDGISEVMTIDQI